MNSCNYSKCENELLHDERRFYCSKKCRKENKREVRKNNSCPQVQKEREEKHQQEMDFIGQFGLTSKISFPITERNEVLF